MRTSSMAPRSMFAAALLAGAAIAAPAFADNRAPGRDQARSMAVTQYGIVATSQAAASQAGVAILEKGGNAIDAAIAANAALAVVEPMMNGIGGDLFAIVYIAKAHQYIGINASGWTPAALSLAALKARGLTRLRPIDQVTVPGMVAGWDMLAKRFGKLGLAHDLGPAIALAEQGFGVAETNAEAWATYSKAHLDAPGFAATFLPGGKAPAAGDLFRNPELGRSLRRIAEHGRDGFYKGPTADAILAMERRLGGFMTADDLVSFTPEWIQPVSTTYHGWTVFELPPNGQGIAALSMLNMMERFPIASWGHNSAKALHVEIEAKKLAYADLQHFVGDPRVTKIPTEALISKALAKDRAATIGERAACHVLPSNVKEALSRQSSDTTYLSVVDKDGNEVSLIQSNSGAFGTGIVPDGTGFPLHNRGAGFNLEDGHPNTLRPRIRPLHTIIPAFMEKGDRHIGFGIMGGFNQAQAHAQFVSNIADFGMNLQGALEAARFTKLDFDGCGVMIENGVDPAVIATLRAQGHDVEVTPRFYQLMGRGNAVETRDGKPVHYGATDPRTDGEAIPEQPPFR